MQPALQITIATSLHTDILPCVSAAVIELLKAGAPADEPDTEGVTPLLKASRNG